MAPPVIIRATMAGPAGLLYSRIFVVHKFYFLFGDMLDCMRPRYARSLNRWQLSAPTARYFEVRAVSYRACSRPSIWVHCSA